MTTNDVVTRLIYSSAVMLDEENFSGFLAGCGEKFRYAIKTFSPELGREMTWLDHTRRGMHDLIGMLPQHVRMKGRLKRHVSVYSIDDDDDTTHVRANSSVLIVHTDPNGKSTLFAAGRYEDVIDVSEGLPRFVERVVRLETRELGPGVHVPL